MKTNQVVYGGTEKKHNLFIFITWSAIVLFFSVPEALDLSRYYQGASSYSGSLISYISDTFERNYDFIYLMSLRILYVLGLPMELATCAYVSFFFIGSLHLVNYFLYHENIHKHNGFLVASLCMVVPFTWVICVSRSTAAFCFLFYAFWNYLRRNKRRCIVFLSLAVLTHVSMALFVMIFVLSKILGSLTKKMSSMHILLLIVGVFLLSSFLSVYLSDFFSLLSYTSFSETRYGGTYLDYEMDEYSFFQSDNLSKSVRAHAAVLFVLNVLTLLIDKRRDVVYSVLLIATILLTFFLFNIQTMVIRMVMFMVPFCAISFTRSYYLYPSKRWIINILLFLSLFCELWEFYNERLSFF